MADFGILKFSVDAVYLKALWTKFGSELQLCFIVLSSCVFFCKFTIPGHCFFMSYVLFFLSSFLFLCAVYCCIATFWVNKDVYRLWQAINARGV